MPYARLRDPAPASASADLIDTAQGLGVFTHLLAALEAARLTESLRADGPFTLFAPTDLAFAKLPAGLLEALMQPDQRLRLRAVLHHHLVAGRLGARHFFGLSLRVPTLQGDELALDGHHGLRADQAHVLHSDRAASNGLLHMIDALLMPVDFGDRKLGAWTAEGMAG